MSMLHPGSYPALTAAALTGSLATIITSFSVADVGVFAIAIAAAFASFRTKRTDAVRQNNHDLEDRNRTLEAEKIRDQALIVQLQNDNSALASKPDLEKQMALLEKIGSSLEANQQVLMQVHAAIHQKGLPE